MRPRSVSGKSESMEPFTVLICRSASSPSGTSIVIESDGTITERSKTFYSTVYGPIVTSRPRRTDGGTTAVG